MMKHGLMTFDHRLPDVADYKTMPIVEFTSDAPWNPSQFTDDSDSVLDVAGVPRDVADLQSAMIHHTQAIDGDAEQFYDATCLEDGFEWFISDTYCARVRSTLNDEGDDDDGQYFFTPSDDIGEKSRLGKAFHLNIDFASKQIWGKRTACLCPNFYR